MSSPTHSSTNKHLFPPTIRIQSASPETAPDQHHPITSSDDKGATGLTPRRTRSLPVGRTSPDHPRHRRKRSATSAQLSTPLESKPIMAGSSRSGSNSSRKHSPSASSSKKSKSSPRDLDWTDVTDPEERRRIQNRIAQRKFREKAREYKEKAERDSRNQEYAGNSYRIPSPGDFNPETELSGLPWGSVNMQHFFARSHEAGGRQSSGQGTYVGDEGFTSVHYGNPYANQLAQSRSYGGSSGGDEVYYDDAYLYDPASRGQ